MKLHTLNKHFSKLLLEALELDLTCLESFHGKKISETMDGLEVLSTWLKGLLESEKSVNKPLVQEHIQIIDSKRDQIWHGSLGDKVVTWVANS